MSETRRVSKSPRSTTTQKRPLVGPAWGAAREMIDRTPGRVKHRSRRKRPRGHVDPVHRMTLKPLPQYVTGVALEPTLGPDVLMATPNPFMDGLGVSPRHQEPE